MIKDVTNDIIKILSNKPNISARTLSITLRREFSYKLKEANKKHINKLLHSNEHNLFNKTNDKKPKWYLEDHNKTQNNEKEFLEWLTYNQGLSNPSKYISSLNTISNDLIKKNILNENNKLLYESQTSRFLVIKHSDYIYKLKEEENKSPKEKYNYTKTLVTDPKLIGWIKNIYNNKCQICLNQIVVPQGFYSEAAHIKAKSDGGFDNKNNILCLCPTCHIQFDMGALWLNENLEVIHFETKNKIANLEISRDHNIDLKNVKFHREKFN